MLEATTLPTYNHCIIAALFLDLRKAILAEVVCGETSHGLAVVKTPATNTQDLLNVNSLKLGSLAPNLQQKFSFNGENTHLLC